MERGGIQRVLHSGLSSCCARVNSIGGQEHADKLTLACLACGGFLEDQLLLRALHAITSLVTRSALVGVSKDSVH